MSHPRSPCPVRVAPDPSCAPPHVSRRDAMRKRTCPHMPMETSPTSSTAHNSKTCGVCAKRFSPHT
eukprot:2215168-Prymnesium_polylepis.1